MDGRRLEFPPETFDIALSFSSIEHFGGKNHSGALKSVREMERVFYGCINLIFRFITEHMKTGS